MKENIPVLGFGFFCSTVAMLLAFYVGTKAMEKNVVGYEYAFLCGVCFLVLSLLSAGYIVRHTLMEGRKTL